MSEIEGATCDECGTRIGPYGCCATIRWKAETLKVREAEISRLEGLIRDLRTGQKATNARLDELERTTAQAREALEAYHRKHCARLSDNTLVECVCAWCRKGAEAVARIETLMSRGSVPTSKDP